MNILQLISSFRNEVSIRAIASYSRVLEDNGNKSYVYGPLGRELSYFKRWGAKIVSQRSSSLDIRYSKTTIKEISDIIISKDIVGIHVYDSPGYQAALQIKKFCKIKIIMSLIKKDVKQTILGKFKKTFLGEYIPKVDTVVPSKAIYHELLTRYSRKNIALSYVPVPIDFTVYDEKKISQERTISLATQWGMLEKPRHIIFTKSYFGSRKWQNQVIGLSAKLEKLPDDIRPYVIVIKDTTDRRRLIEFEEKFFKNRNSVLCLMDELNDLEAGLKLSSIYLELNPKKDYYSLDILNALAMGSLVVAWRNSVTQELVPHEYHDYLAEVNDLNALLGILIKLLKMKEHERNFTGRTCRNFVLNNFNTKNVEELLMNAYSTLSLKKAS